MKLRDFTEEQMNDIKFGALNDFATRELLFKQGSHGRDLVRKEKLNMRKLKTLVSEYEFLQKKYSKGSMPKCIRNRITRLETVIELKTLIYEEALKNAKVVKGNEND